MKSFQVGEELPTPVDALVRGAFHTAVRRWTAADRHEMAAEWTAELYEIAHDTTSTVTQRAWRSLTYTVSLALARGHQEPRREGHDMRRHWKPVLGLVTTALLMSAFTALVIGAASAAEELYLDPIVNLPPAPWTYEWTPYLIVVCAVVCWYAGRLLARRVPLRAASPYMVTVLSAACVFLGSALFVGAEMGMDMVAGRGTYLPWHSGFVATGISVFFLGYLSSHPDTRAASKHAMAARSIEPSTPESHENSEADSAR